MKRKIKLTESQLHNIVKKCTNEVIESTNVYDEYTDYRKDTISDLMQINAWSKKYLTGGINWITDIYNGIKSEYEDDEELLTLIWNVIDDLETAQSDIYEIMKKIKRVPIANTMYGD